MIGCGTMGLGVLRGVLAARVVSAARLQGCDPDAGCVAALRRSGIRVAASNPALVASSDLVILAVKPQDLRGVLQGIAAALTRRPLLISIAAGWSTRAIEREVGARVPVIRVMPNLPAQIREGMAVLCRGRWATEAHARLARTVFGALGDVLELPERLFHAVTAVSGSGPAYLWYLMEAMQEAGRRLGVPAGALERLVTQTAVGSARLARASHESPAVLRARVTSKGGTTAAAVRVFDQARVRERLVRGILAAARRSAQLGR